MRPHSPIQFLILTLAVILLGVQTCGAGLKISDAIDRVAEKCGKP